MIQKEINEKNEDIAAFLGWYRMTGQPEDVWFKETDCSQIVIYQQYKDPSKELPFHKDWNYLMDVVLEIEKVGYGMEIIPSGVLVYDMKTALCDTRFSSIVLPRFYDVENIKIKTIWNAVAAFVKWYVKNVEEK